MKFVSTPHGPRAKCWDCREKHVTEIQVLAPALHVLEKEGAAMNPIEQGLVVGGGYAIGWLVMTAVTWVRDRRSRR